MTVRRSRLTDRRVELGLTQEALAERVGASTASVRRWETGISTPRTRQRQPLAKVLQMTLPELERTLSDQGGPPAPNGHEVPAWLDHYASLEQGAARLQTVEPIVVPGLLQTEAYARAVVRHYYLPVADDDIESRVRSRMARQVVLERRPDPLELRCVIDESVLSRVTGGLDVMADQLDHLVALGDRPSVLIQVMPADGPGLHSTWFGGFNMFTSAQAETPFMICTDHLGGVQYNDSQQAIEAHVGLFEHLCHIALPPEQSAELIHTRAERYR